MKKLLISLSLMSCISFASESPTGVFVHYFDSLSKSCVLDSQKTVGFFDRVVPKCIEKRGGWVLEKIENLSSSDEIKLRVYAENTLGNLVYDALISADPKIVSDILSNPNIANENLHVTTDEKCSSGLVHLVKSIIFQKL